MRYVGSKNRLSKYLVPIIQSYITPETEGYLEPFVGGANMIDKIKCTNKIGCDIHEELIALLRHAQETTDDIPERILEDEYKKVKENKTKTDKPWSGVMFMAWYVFCKDYKGKPSYNWLFREE